MCGVWVAYSPNFSHTDLSFRYQLALSNALIHLTLFDISYLWDVLLTLGRQSSPPAGGHSQQDGMSAPQ